MTQPNTPEANKSHPLNAINVIDPCPAVRVVAEVDRFFFGVSVTQLPPAHGDPMAGVAVRAKDEDPAPPFGRMLSEPTRQRR